MQRCCGACRRYHDYSKAEWQEKDLPDWENPAVNRVNTVRATCHDGELPGQLSPL
ncbi:MAG: hypothetical protein MZV63_68325 [Marinilabiliales bacterium]|nr:hypothetical protein [Marinilabiliales bacterium]